MENLNEFNYGFHSNILQSYVDAASPHAVNTAWAMLALIYAGQVCFLHGSFELTLGCSHIINCKLFWHPHVIFISWPFYSG